MSAFKPGDKVRHVDSTSGMVGTVKAVYCTDNRPYEVVWPKLAFENRFFASDLILDVSGDKIHTRLGAHGWIGSYNPEINRWLYTRGTSPHQEFIELYSDVAYYTQGKRSLRGTHEEIVSLCGEIAQTSALVRKTTTELDEWRKHFGDTQDWTFARAIDHLRSYLVLLEERGE